MIDDADGGTHIDVDYKDLLIDLMHQLREINKVIKSSSEILSRSIQGEKIDRNNIEHHASQIIDNSNLLSLWLNVIDSETNPTAFVDRKLEPRSLFGKFKKAEMSFRRMAKDERVSITISGESKTLIDAYPIIDLLPYLLLENAIKYSPNSGSVGIHFDESSTLIEIVVRSMGPTLKAEEVEHIFEKGFRGERASQVSLQGSGRGLALAKKIADIHDAEIIVEVGKSQYIFNGTPHSAFSILLKFSKK